MFKKRVITMVGNEVVFSNTIFLDETQIDTIEKLTAVFASNPTIQLTDDLNAVEGSVWDGQKFIYPEV